MNQNKIPNKFPEYISDQIWDEGLDLLTEKNKTSDILKAIKSIKSFIYNKKEQTMDLDQAYSTIYNNLIQDKEATKEFGEVFTSFELINEMLDLLPKEVWSNPELKWLDPCAVKPPTLPTCKVNLANTSITFGLFCM